MLGIAYGNRNHPKADALPTPTPECVTTQKYRKPGATVHSLQEAQQDPQTLTFFLLPLLERSLNFR